MIIREKSGSLKDMDRRGRAIDVVALEWYETGKRILHKRSKEGREVVMKFLKEAPNLMQDDVIYEDDVCLIAIDILPCEAIVVRPKTMYQMACLCYEVGNKHLPLFYQEEEILTPYEAPLFRLLQNTGFEPGKESRKLMHPLKTTVAPHLHGGNNETLFSKIMKLTAANG